MNGKTAVVVIPTYNEAQVIEGLLQELFEVTIPSIRAWTVYVLVVDGSSPDGTAVRVRREQKRFPNLHLIVEQEKQGIGAAYFKGFDYAVKELKADVLIEFDGDFQHPPETIPALLERIDGGADLVLGSRRVPGGSYPSGWGFRRQLFSRVGGFVARLLLFFPTKAFFRVTDPTTGLKATRVAGFYVPLLSQASGISGFGYKIVMLYHLVHMGAQIAEIPLKFGLRAAGESKITAQTPREIFTTVLRLRWQDEALRRFLRFCLVGFSGFLVNALALELFARAPIFAAFSRLFEEWRNRPVVGIAVQASAWAAAAAAECAIINNYLWNNFWTFTKQRAEGWPSLFTGFIKFNFTSFGAILLQFLCVGLATRAIADTTLVRQIALIATIVLIIAPYNWLIYNRVIWRTHGDRESSKRERPSTIAADALNRQSTGWEAACFIVLLALIKMLYGSYSFGLSDTIDHLPIIYRFVDPSYLANDFQVNVSASFGPRYYYAAFIALLARLVPMEIVFLSLTFLTNVAIAAASFLAARALFRSSRVAPLLATVLVMTVNPIFELGDLVNEYLKPSFIARLFAFASLWVALERKPLASMLGACLSSLFHPTLGLEIGVFSLVLMGSALLVESAQSRNLHLQGLWLVFRPLVVSAAVLGIWTLLFWLIPYKMSLDAFKLDEAQFLQIILFRTERTTVPSSFSPRVWASLALVLGLFTYAWRKWYRSRSRDKTQALSVLCLIGFLLMFCLGGYLFIEVFPSRAWATARAFRMLFVLNWLALIIATGVLASSRNWLALTCISFLFIGGSALFGEVEIPPLVFGSVLLLAFIALPLVRRTWVSYAALALFVSVMLLDTVRPFLLPEVFQSVRPHAGYTSGLNAAGDELAAFVRANTEKEAVFLTPPDFGAFRLAAQRAIVVDWKSMPFQDAGMLEWWRRMNDCYGDLRGLSRSEGMEKMENVYQALTSEQILRIGKRYGARYAVLYQPSLSELPVIFKNDRFTLIAISE